MEMTKAEVLSKVQADGPLGLQYICVKTFKSGEESAECEDGIINHLKELQTERKVKYIKGKPGKLDKWEAI